VLQVKRNLTRIVLAVSSLVAGVLGGQVAAQPVSDTINITALNSGGTNFQITLGSYTFGTVSPNGGPNIGGTQALNGVPNAAGAVYTASAATTWTARSAPPRTIHIHNASVFSSILWGTADRLEMQIPTTNLPAAAQSCGYKTFSTIGSGGAAGCGAGNLLRNLSAGMGINERTGNLDFRLTVNNVDAAGTNTWVVVLTAVGF
jgi:hypothetical protein